MSPTNTPTRCRENSFFSKLTIALVCIFFILMAIISIAWLIMHPHDPGFQVTSLSVTNFNVSDSQVRGKYEVGLTITNRNKFKTQVVSHGVGVLRLYREEWHSMAAVQQQKRVFMEKLTNKSVKIDLVVSESRKKVVPEDLVKDWNKGVVNFNVVVLSVKVIFESGIWPSMDKLLDVQCTNLDLEFHSPTKDTGKLLGIGKNCYTNNVGGRT
ncbi:hypothetical protein VNO78_05886 [Psophocarpus tetragonolobus]|uniref:Late embryogenesis abundant protein LEA-2 subgroup domain-containing protein n=1 Tax=Psophocarpus tetragonolobus TaxID=3891 RepID=A0AAN9SSF9_PSOTE